MLLQYFSICNNGNSIDFIPRYTGITGILPSTNLSLEHQQEALPINSSQLAAW